MGVVTTQGEVSTAEKRQASTVLVSGASFAGLAAAWWMNKLGYTVTVVEIASGLRKGGTPVNIRGDVIDVARRMNLLERIKAASLPPRPVTFLDADGAPLSLAAAQPEEEPEEEYEIERDDLLEMLFNEVKDNVEFLFADSISALEESAQEVAVTFASGRKRSFSPSWLRWHPLRREKDVLRREASFLMYLQNYFSLSIVDKLLIEEDTSQMFSVPGKTVMLNAYNGKTDIAFCFFSEKEKVYDRRKQEDQKRMIREQFEGMAWRTGELLDEISQCDNFYFDQLCQVRMGSWTKGRVALVGDAGYCPSPAAGMGGSMAILGAAALADAFHKHPGDFTAAFKAYDQGFRSTVEEIQANAVEVGLEMFMPRSEEAIQRRNMQLGLG